MHLSCQSAVTGPIPPKRPKNRHATPLVSQLSLPSVSIRATWVSVGATRPANGVWSPEAENVTILAAVSGASLTMRWPIQFQLLFPTLLVVVLTIVLASAVSAYFGGMYARQQRG